MKFVVENTYRNDIYIVHYNGFVFGADNEKIIKIREREKNVN